MASGSEAGFIITGVAKCVKEAASLPLKAAWTACILTQTSQQLSPPWSCHACLTASRPVRAKAVTKIMQNATAIYFFKSTRSI